MGSNNKLVRANWLILEKFSCWTTDFQYTENAVYELRSSNHLWRTNILIVGFESDSITNILIVGFEGDSITNILIVGFESESITNLGAKMQSHK